MLSAIRNAAIALALVLPASAFASSEEAWDQFAKEVEQKCTDAASGSFRKLQVIVDPVGSQNFGLALIFGRYAKVKGRATMVCIVDKKTGAVELGSDIGPEIQNARRPASKKNANQAPRKNQQTQNSSQGQDEQQDESPNSGDDQTDGQQ